MKCQNTSHRISNSWMEKAAETAKPPAMKAKKSPPTRKKGTSKTHEKAPPKHLDMPPKQLKRQDEHKRKKPYWAKHVTIVTSIWQKMQRSFLRTWLGLDYWTISWRSCWILEPTQKSSPNTKTARNIGGILDGSEVHPLNQPQVRWCLKIWGRIGFQPLNEPTSGWSIFEGLMTWVPWVPLKHAGKCITLSKSLPKYQSVVILRQDNTSLTKKKSWNKCANLCFLFPCIVLFLK